MSNLISFSNIHLSMAENYDRKAQESALLGGRSVKEDVQAAEK